MDTRGWGGHVDQKTAMEEKAGDKSGEKPFSGQTQESLKESKYGKGQRQEIKELGGLMRRMVGRASGGGSWGMVTSTSDGLDKSC